jgi:hypothetical protein
MRDAFGPFTGAAGLASPAIVAARSATTLMLAGRATTRPGQEVRQRYARLDVEPSMLMTTMRPQFRQHTRTSSLPDREPRLANRPSSSRHGSASVESEQARNRLYRFSTDFGAVPAVFSRQMPDQCTGQLVGNV